MDCCDRKQVKLSDFDAICRFCMRFDLFLKPLFYDGDDGASDDFASEDGANESVTEMVARCTQLEIKLDDKLPKFMCNSCLEELLRCNKFRRRCLLSDATLKKILETQTIEDEPTESDKTDVENRTSSLDDIYGVEKIYNLKDDELVQINQRSEELFNWSSRVPSEKCQECNIPKMSRSIVLEEQYYLGTTLNCGSHITSRKSERITSEKISKRPDILRLEIDSRQKTRRKRSRLYNPSGHYRCNQCSKRFRTLRCLANHGRVHARENQPLKCWLCGGIFLLPMAYRSHMQSHKIGGREFRSRNQLRTS